MRTCINAESVKKSSLNRNKMNVILITSSKYLSFALTDFMLKFKVNTQ